MTRSTKETITDTVDKGNQSVDAHNPAPQPVRTLAHLFGELVWLMSVSPQYSQFKVSDLEWLAMPALSLQQFHMFYEGKRAVAAALWANLSEAAELRYMAGDVRLRPEDWNSGDRAWLIELIAPIGKPEDQIVARILTSLGRGIMPKSAFRLMMTDPATGVRSVIQYSEEQGLKPIE